MNEKRSRGIYLSHLDGVSDDGWVDGRTDHRWVIDVNFLIYILFSFPFAGRRQPKAQMPVMSSSMSGQNIHSYFHEYSKSPSV